MGHLERNRVLTVCQRGFGQKWLLLSNMIRFLYGVISRLEKLSESKSTV